MVRGATARLGLEHPPGSRSRRSASARNAVLRCPRLCPCSEHQVTARRRRGPSRWENGGSIVAARAVVSTETSAALAGRAEECRWRGKSHCPDSNINGRQPALSCSSQRRRKRSRVELGAPKQGMPRSVAGVLLFQSKNLCRRWRKNHGRRRRSVAHVSAAPRAGACRKGSSGPGEASGRPVPCGRNAPRYAPAGRFLGLERTRRRLHQLLRALDCRVRPPAGGGPRRPAVAERPRRVLATCRVGFGDAGPPALRSHALRRAGQLAAARGLSLPRWPAGIAGGSSGRASRARAQGCRSPALPPVVGAEPCRNRAPAAGLDPHRARQRAFATAATTLDATRPPADRPRQGSWSSLAHTGTQAVVPRLPVRTGRPRT